MHRTFRNASTVVFAAVRAVHEAAEAAGLEASVVRFGELDYVLVREAGSSILVVDVYENRDGLQVAVIGIDYWSDFRPRFLAGLVERGLRYTYRLPDAAREWHLASLLYWGAPDARGQADVTTVAAGRRVEREMTRLLRRGLTVDQACEVRRLVRLYDVPEADVIALMQARTCRYTIAEVRKHVATAYARRDAPRQPKGVTPQQLRQALRASGITYSR